MNFAVYTRNGCPYCTKIKQVLRGKGHSFTEYRLDTHFNREEFYQQFGAGSTFPSSVRLKTSRRLHRNCQISQRKQPCLVLNNLEFKT